MKFHHTTIIENMGICSVCGGPFRYYWKDKEQQNGRSDQYVKQGRGKYIHFKCSGGKSLTELNEERKALIFSYLSLVLRSNVNKSS